MTWIGFLIEIKSIFAGIKPLIVDWGIPVGIIVGIILIELFATSIGAAVPILEPILTKFRKDLLWIAIVIAGALAYGAKVQHDEILRCKAKQQVIQKAITDIVNDATHPTNKTIDDPFDSKDN